jgi:hypothetical protein
MKKNMFVALLAVSTLLVSADVKGQTPAAPVARERMLAAPNAGMDRLKLTDDQKAKVQALRKEYAVKDSVSMSKMHDERKASMEKQNAAFESILTSEQKEQWKKMREEMPNTQANGPMGFGRGMGQFPEGRQMMQGRQGMQEQAAHQGRQSMQGSVAMQGSQKTQGRHGMQGQEAPQGRQSMQGPETQLGRQSQNGPVAQQGRQSMQGAAAMQGRSVETQGRGFAQTAETKGQKKGQFAKAKAPNKMGLFAKQRMAKQSKRFAKARERAVRQS